MILLRPILRHFYHFVSPSLSSLSSRAHLQSVAQERLVRNLREVNHHRITPFDLANSLKDELMIGYESIAEIKVRNIAVSIINPQTMQCQIYETRLDKDIKNTIKGVESGFPFRNSDEEFHHFSETRGTPNFEELKEYQFDNRTLFVFNLPENVSKEDLQVKFKNNNVSVQLKYCVLGLPAYARVVFERPEELIESLELIPSRRLQFGERIAVIKTSEEEEVLRLGNRRLVVPLGENSKLEEYLLDFSRFGRVMHLDWPLEATLIPRVEEVKEFFKDSSELVKINQHHQDGSVESEYFPAMRVFDLKEDEREIDDFITRSEHLKDVYDNRSRFARNINIEMGREGESVLKNRGYCVVTYSTYEEAQGYYFINGSNGKIELVGERLDFEFDPTFRTELLRQIDNEYLVGKKRAQEEKEAHNAKYLDPERKTKEEDSLESWGNKMLERKRRYYNYDPNEKADHYLLEERIFRRIYNEESLTKTKKSPRFQFRELIQDNRRRDWEDQLEKYRQAKEQVNNKSFDELAEIELFGRVLPKDKYLERLIAQDTKHRELVENQLLKDNNLLTQKYDIFKRDKFYERQQERRNRLAIEALGIPPAEEGEKAEGEAAEGEQGEQQQQQEGETNIGKKSFSTYKPFALYRERDAEEEAHYQHRYHEFIRSLIYEYMGVFHDKLIEEASSNKADYLNPENLKFSTGQPFLREQDIVESLQFRRDFKKAQIDYEDYVYGINFFKSSGVSAEHLNAHYRSLYPQGLQYLSDVGLVEEIKEVSGDNLEESVRVLNAQIAEFGEEYRLKKEGDKTYLVKLVKYEPLSQPARMENMEEFVEENGNEVPPRQAFLFNKHFEKIRETGIIPEEVLEAFGLPPKVTVDDLLAEVGAKVNISRKDLLLSERVAKISAESMKEEEIEQLAIERERRSNEKKGSESFAKDTSEIYVKDREGYFRVSRYRQI